jgi:hypothetical protein
MNSYSIVITTFDQRFEPFLKPLIDQIKLQRPPVEIICMVNGLCKNPFNQSYRAALLEFLSKHENCFPTIFPTFVSLAKLWNRGALTASQDRIIIMNDDLTIHPGFFDRLEQALKENSTSFKINGSFSHFALNKKELLEVGFFDERLLGLGEEDGDFYWRYFQQFKREMPSIEVLGIDNIQSDIADTGYAKGIRTAAQFNRAFIKKQKYQDVFLGGHKGMFDKRVKKLLPDEKQYPYEQFYLDHKHEL